MKETRKQKIARQRDFAAGHAADQAMNPIRVAIDRGDLVITPTTESVNERIELPPETTGDETLIAKCRESITALRDAARSGGMHVFERDDHVVLLQRALDKLASRPSQEREP